MNTRRSLLCLPLALGAAGPLTLFAQAAKPALEVSIEDASAAFLRLYEQWGKPEQTDATRLAAWQQDYVLKGVPQNAAAFASAWPRYAAQIDRIKAGFDGIKPSPVQALSRIAGAARFAQSLKLVLVAYVGTFDQPARLIERGDEQVLALPLELDTQLLASQAAHALTGLIVPSTEYAPTRAKNLAERMALEGIALNLVRDGLDTTDDALVWKPYASDFAQTYARRVELARALKPQLADTRPETLARLTATGGPTPRQAQVLGYIVIKSWLNRGMAFSEIAKIKPADLVRTMGDRLDLITR